VSILPKKERVASDYSPGMVVAPQLAATNKVKISGRTMNAIALDCPDNTLILFTPPTCHHLPEPETAIGDAPRSQARR